MEEIVWNNMAKEEVLTADYLKSLGFTYYESSNDYFISLYSADRHDTVDIDIFNVDGGEYDGIQLHIEDSHETTIMHIMNCNTVEKFKMAMALLEINI